MPATFRPGPVRARFVFVKGIAYGLSWIVFPVAMIFLCRLLGLTETYVPYIIALNWSAIIQTAIFFRSRFSARRAPCPPESRRRSPSL